jgi:hypothetical protein
MRGEMGSSFSDNFSFIDNGEGPLRHNFSFLDIPQTTITNDVPNEPQPIQNNRQQEYNQSSMNFELPQLSRPESKTDNNYELDLDRFKNTRDADPYIMQAPQRK